MVQGRGRLAQEEQRRARAVQEASRARAGDAQLVQWHWPVSLTCGINRHTRRSRTRGTPSEEVDNGTNFRYKITDRGCSWRCVDSELGELPLALPLHLWGIAHSLAAETPPGSQCTRQVTLRL